LAAPISLALLVPQVSFLTNTAFLGRFGERELGVNGVCGIFYLIISMIGYGLSSGMQVQMARRAGEGDDSGLAKVFINGIMLSFMFALGLMMLSLWATPIIFGLSLHDSDNIELTINFLYLRVWGLPFLMLTQIANSFFISIHRPRFLIYGSIAGAVVNIFFDYVLIFGNFGFPQWGLAGAAVASIIAEFAGCITMYGIFYFRRLYEQYPIQQFARFDLRLSKRTLKVASPLIIQFMFSIGGWQVFFIFVEHLGQQQLAASQILRSIFGIVGVVTWAFAATCNTVVSNIIGQGKQKRVIPAIVKIARLSLSFTGVLCLLLLVFSHPFLRLYSTDEALVNFAVPSLRIIVLATLIMSVSTVAFNGVVGTGNTLVNLFLEVACVCTYLTYCYFVIERGHSSLEWAWVSEFVYWSSLFLVSFFYLRSGRWKGKVI
jgi:putative MATE family efflux protein